jgi:hypothetical protein
MKRPADLKKLGAEDGLHAALAAKHIKTITINLILFTLNLTSIVGINYLWEEEL